MGSFLIVVYCVGSVTRSCRCFACSYSMSKSVCEDFIYMTLLITNNTNKNVNIIITNPNSKFSKE